MTDYHTEAGRATVGLRLRRTRKSRPQEDIMNRRCLLAVVAMACLGMPLLADAAEQPRPAQQQFVGTWTLVSIHYVTADGHKVEPFGPGAKGLLYFDAAGRFATQVMTASRPRFASNNRMLGTADENKAMSQGVVAYFGSYTTSDADRILTLHIEQSSFPNWNGTEQKRVFTFTGDELHYTAAGSTANPAESAELVWKRLR
jgi:hypothetical protein